MYVCKQGNLIVILSFTLDGKPVMVTQYVGGDMMPEDVTKRKGEVDDLQESANHPELLRVQSSERYQTKSLIFRFSFKFNKCESNINYPPAEKTELPPSLKLASLYNSV